MELIFSSNICTLWWYVLQDVPFIFLFHFYRFKTASGNFSCSTSMQKIWGVSLSPRLPSLSNNHPRVQASVKLLLQQSWWIQLHPSWLSSLLGPPSKLPRKIARELRRGKSLWQWSYCPSPQAKGTRVTSTGTPASAGYSCKWLQQSNSSYIDIKCHKISWIKKDFGGQDEGTNVDFSDIGELSALGLKVDNEDPLLENLLNVGTMNHASEAAGTWINPSLCHCV